MTVKYPVELSRLEGMFLRRACIMASAECDETMASLYKVPDDLRTNGWNRALGLQDRKRRFEDLAEQMHGIAYPVHEREAWEDIVDGLD